MLVLAPSQLDLYVEIWNDKVLEFSSASALTGVCTDNLIFLPGMGPGY